MDILLIARIFPLPANTTQLAKYPHVLYAKPSNKVFVSSMEGQNFIGEGSQNPGEDMNLNENSVWVKAAKPCTRDQCG